jgi:protein-tyrosine kinase
MSRIHEALKKAAEERSAHTLNSTSNDVVDIAPQIPRPVIPTATLTAESTPREVRGSETAQYLLYEDLIHRCNRTEWGINQQFSVFQNSDMSRVGAERFQTLRSRLYQIANTRPLRRVLVTSSVPAEGKTFVVSNLAQSIARQPDRRVLLMDADLRAPRLHLLLGAASSPGLTDYLRGEADEYSVIQNGSVGNLCFIASGGEVSNPSELLFGARLKKLLDLVTPAFDWIILDSPPALPVHDASMLADLCDGVLFVVRAGETSHELAEKASSEFRSKNSLGVVLNYVDKDAAYGGYYYNYSAESEKYNK